MRFFAILAHRTGVCPERCRKDVNKICIQAMHVGVYSVGGGVSMLRKCMNFISTAWVQ